MPIALALLMLVPVTVHAAPDIPPRVVNRLMKEADAIWREAGVELEWHGVDDGVTASLHVEIGDARGKAEGTDLPVAWIGFVDARPNDEIYVSRVNAQALFEASVTMGRWTDLPPAAINEYLGRALGRALAHEIGHYLFRSTDHDRHGVMATRRPSKDFFGFDRSAFRLTADELNRLTVVLQRNRLAQRSPSPFD